MLSGPAATDHLGDLRELVSADATTAIFNPMTRPFDTTQVDYVRIGRWLDSNDVTVDTAVQFSDNGVDFDSAIAIGGSFASTVGWVHPTAFSSIFGLSGTKRLYCRFGLLVKNISGTKTGGAQARLSIEIRPSAGRTVVGGPLQLNTDGTTTAVFHPMTGALQSADISAVRGTVMLDAASGVGGGGESLIQLRPAGQETDTPDDDTTWSGTVAFEAYVTEEGTSYGTTFSAASLTKRYVRFGLLARNDSGSSDIEACRATLRVDLRK